MLKQLVIECSFDEDVWLLMSEERMKEEEEKTWKEEKEGKGGRKLQAQIPKETME